MTTGKIILITLLAGIVSVAAGLLGQKYLAPAQRHGQPPSLIPQPTTARTTLPEFEFPDLSQRPQRSSRWAGKVLILNFWATWCPPCRAEIPEFIRLQDEFGKQGLQFVGIAIDEPEQVRSFAGEAGINYPVLLGDERAVELSRRLGNRFQGLPFSVIFDRRGNVAYFQGGELKRSIIEEKVAPLL